MNKKYSAEGVMMLQLTRVFSEPRRLRIPISILIICIKKKAYGRSICGTLQVYIIQNRALNSIY